MKQILIPGTALTTSRLGFGTASLHHLPTTAQRLNLLATAHEQGFSYFDTAPLYGEGLAERSVGLFAAKGRRQRLTLSTKVGLPARPLPQAVPWWMYVEKASDGVWRRLGRRGQPRRWRTLSENDAERSFTQSLRALQTDAVDILFIHEPTAAEVPDIERLVPWLERQRTAGRARYLGLSGNAAACVAVNRQVPRVFDVLQVEDSLAGLEADAVVEEGLPLQITYGYMRLASRQASEAVPPLEPPAVLALALARNTTGVVLISTRKVSRLVELAKDACGHSGP